MSPRIHKLEGATKGLAKARSIVPLYGETAASFRPIKREGCDDCVPSDFQSALQARDIRSTVTVLGEEMEGGPIMPDVICSWRLPDRSVRDNPMNPFSKASKAALSGLKCGLRQIENGYIFKTSINKIVDQT
jgi:hypothetical protein